MKNEKGITLIALIITIIVMLILVLVTINIATTGGIVNKTIEAKTQTKAVTQNELNQMNTVANGIDAAIAESATILQPDVLYVPTEGETLTTIYINPDPSQPDELFPVLDVDESPYNIGMQLLSEAGENKIKMLEILAQNERVDYYEKQFVQILYCEIESNVDGLVYTGNIYMRVWESGTFDLLKTGEPQTYLAGWNKMTFNRTDNTEGLILSIDIGDPILIKPNQLPKITGAFVVPDLSNAYSIYIGNFMHPTWNYGIF